MNLTINKLHNGDFEVMNKNNSLEPMLRNESKISNVNSDGGVVITPSNFTYDLGIEKIHPSTQEFLNLLDRMREVALAKSHDYAGSKDPMSNFKMSENMGIPAWKAIVVRLGDKYSRIMNFCKKESLQVKDEAITDTLLDMANYSLLCIIMYNQSKK